MVCSCVVMLVILACMANDQDHPSRASSSDFAFSAVYLLVPSFGTLNGPLPAKDATPCGEWGKMATVAW